jgi:hypothetical protein
MTERQASFLICDDLLVSLNGKFFLHGVYTGDIAIAAEESRLVQLILLLQISTPVERPFRSLEISVSLPGETTPRVMDLMRLLPATLGHPGRTIANYKIPFPLVQPVLRAGMIEVRIRHDEGEILVGRQWVISPSQVQEMMKQDTTRN